MLFIQMKVQQVKADSPQSSPVTTARAQSGPVETVTQNKDMTCDRPQRKIMSTKETKYKDFVCD